MTQQCSGRRMNPLPQGKRPPAIHTAARRPSRTDESHLPVRSCLFILMRCSDAPRRPPFGSRLPDKVSARHSVPPAAACRCRVCCLCFSPAPALCPCRRCHGGECLDSPGAPPIRPLPAGSLPRPSRCAPPAHKALLLLRCAAVPWWPQAKRQALHVLTPGDVPRQAAPARQQTRPA